MFFSYIFHTHLLCKPFILKLTSVCLSNERDNTWAQICLKESADCSLEIAKRSILLLFQFSFLCLLASRRGIWRIPRHNMYIFIIIFRFWRPSKQSVWIFSVVVVCTFTISTISHTLIVYWSLFSKTKIKWMFRFDWLDKRFVWPARGKEFLCAQLHCLSLSLYLLHNWKDLHISMMLKFFYQY